MINGSKYIFVELGRSTEDVCKYCDFYKGDGTCSIYDYESNLMATDYCMYEENGSKIWKKLNNKQNDKKNSNKQG